VPNDTSIAIGAEYRKETQRLQPRVLFFALILLLSHFLDLKPAEVSFAGVKMVVSDIAIVHGGLALIFLYYFWMMVEATFQGSVLSPLHVMPRTLRFLIKTARKPYRDEKVKRHVKRSPKQVKRFARSWMTVYQLFGTPFALIAIAVILSALFFGLSDVWTLVKYLYENLISRSD
jgi:hypothetical protein